MINDLIHLQYTFGYIAQSVDKNTQNSPKGNLVTEQLIDVKKEIKKKSLLIKDKEELLEKLEEIKIFIESNKADFTKFDNIPGKLNQIEQYKNKLNGIPNKPKEKVTTIIEPEQPKKKFKVVLRKHSLDTESY